MVLLFLAPLLPLASSASAQEAEVDKIVKELNFANDPTKLAFQGQAIARLVKRGPAMVDVLLGWVEAKGRPALSYGFTAALADVQDPRIADLMVACLEDPKFLWRPHAARALSAQKAAKHLAYLRKMLSDPLWGVRAPAIHALELLGDRESKDAIRKLFDDPSYDVRAQAARTLHAWGDESGLPILVAALRSDAKWFEIDYGQLAREDACNFLKKLNNNDDFGFKAWETPEQRAPGLKKWEDWMASRDPKWLEKLPPNAKVEADRSTYVFGLEVRNCQRGDYFFRIDTGGNLVIGYFNLTRHPLTPELRAAFDKGVDAVKKTPRGVPYGMGGCDYEKYYVANDKGAFDRLSIGVRGRPAALDAFVDAALALLKDRAGEAESREYRERTAIFREPD